VNVTHEQGVVANEGHMEALPFFGPWLAPNVLPGVRVGQLGPWTLDLSSRRCGHS